MTPEQEQLLTTLSTITPEEGYTAIRKMMKTEFWKAGEKEFFTDPRFVSFAQAWFSDHGRVVQALSKGN